MRVRDYSNDDEEHVKRVSYYEPFGRDISRKVEELQHGYLFEENVIFLEVGEQVIIGSVKHDFSERVRIKVSLPKH